MEAFWESGSETLFCRLGVTKVKKKKNSKRSDICDMWLHYKTIQMYVKLHIGFCNTKCVAFFGILLAFDFQEKQNGCLFNVDTHICTLAIP